MMMKKFYSLIIMLILSMVFCSASFAVEIADGMTQDPGMSQMALTMVLQQYEVAKAQLMQMAAAANPDQKAMYEELIAKLEGDKINKIDSIKVYFADETIPGEAYDSLRAFYEKELSGMRDIAPQEALGKLPAGTEIPADLQALLDTGEVKAAYGTSGKSRVSISNVYIVPQSDNSYSFVEGTVLIIATEK